MTMGEENTSCMFYSVDGGALSRFDGLQIVDLTVVDGSESTYHKVDLSASEDLVFTVESILTPEFVSLAFGTPYPNTDSEDDLARFKEDMWPLFSEGKLSRKRFKKLLMSHNVGRNLAEKTAMHYNRLRIPYFSAYKEAVAFCWIKGLTEEWTQDKDGE